MQSKIQLIQHKGKEVVYSDYSNLEGAQFVETIMSHHREHRALIEECKIDILFLTNVTNCMAGAEVITAFKQTVKENQPYIKKSAVIGAVGTQLVALNTINFFSATTSQSFDTMEEALDWLVK